MAGDGGRWREMARALHEVHLGEVRLDRDHLPCGAVDAHRGPVVVLGPRSKRRVELDKVALRLAHVPASEGARFRHRQRGAAQVEREAHAGRVRATGSRGVFSSAATTGFQHECCRATTTAVATSVVVRKLRRAQPHAALELGPSVLGALGHGEHTRGGVAQLVPSSPNAVGKVEAEVGEDVAGSRHHHVVRVASHKVDSSLTSWSTHYRTVYDLRKVAAEGTRQKAWAHRFQVCHYNR